MDASWTSSIWALVMMLLFGCGAGAITYFGLKIANAPRLPRNMRAVRDELELGCRRVINANMQLMEAVQELAEIQKSLPPEYQPVANQALRLAQLMEEATYAEGAREGVFPRPLFGAYQTSANAPEEGGYTPAPVVDLDAAEARLDEAEARALGYGDWQEVAGQLVRST